MSEDFTKKYEFKGKVLRVSFSHDFTDKVFSKFSSPINPAYDLVPRSIHAVLLETEHEGVGKQIVLQVDANKIASARLLRQQDSVKVVFNYQFKPDSYEQCWRAVDSIEIESASSS